MEKEPLTLASLAPIERPTKRAELNGHTLSRGGGGYWGVGGGRPESTPYSSSPSRKSQNTVLHIYSNLNYSQDTCSARHVQGTGLCAGEHRHVRPVRTSLVDVTVYVRAIISIVGILIIRG